MNSKKCNYWNIDWSRVWFYWQRPRQRPKKMACLEFCGGVHTAQIQRRVYTCYRHCYLYRSRPWCRAVWMNHQTRPRRSTVSISCFFFFLNFWRICGATEPFFWVLVTSSLGFKVRVDSLIRAWRRRTYFMFLSTILNPTLLIFQSRPQANTLYLTNSYRRVVWPWLVWLFRMVHWFQLGFPQRRGSSIHNLQIVATPWICKTMPSLSAVYS